MVSAAVSSETWDNGSSPISEIDVLWLTAGLGCDGDTIAMTAATQPSIEDILQGAMPLDTKGEIAQSLPCLNTEATWAR
jgi:hypothetical protein